MKWLLTAALGLAACSTTQTLSVWKKPGIGALSFKRVVVMVPSKDESVRRQIEDRVAADLASVQAQPSYRVLPAGPLPTDKEVLRQTLAQEGFDGGLVIRIAAVDKEATYVPGPMPYYGFGAWPMYDPGFVSVDTYVRVETSIYALPDGDLLFSVTSRTANPPDLGDLIDETVTAVREQLQKQGLTAPPVSVR
jgi:hypothetical protein